MTDIHPLEEALRAAENTQPTENTMRIFIAGPMTGHPHYNYPVFEHVAETLRAAVPHATVVAPNELIRNEDGTPDFTRPWDEYLRASITALATCTHIVVLPGWKDSRGARLEWTVADALGLTIWDYTPVLVATLTLGNALGEAMAATLLDTLGLKAEGLE